MPGIAELQQLAQVEGLAGKHAPSSPPIGNNLGLLARLTGTAYGGHQVPLHVMTAATAQARVAQAMAERGKK